jgi:hypothetical protein
MSISIAGYIAASLLAQALITTLTALGDITKPAWMGVAEAALRAGLLVPAISWAGIVAVPIVGATTLLALGMWSLARLGGYQIRLLRSSSLAAVGGALILATSLGLIGEHMQNITWGEWLIVSVLGCILISALVLHLNRTLRSVIHEEWRQRIH